MDTDAVSKVCNNIFVSIKDDKAVYMMRQNPSLSSAIALEHTLVMNNVFDKEHISEADKVLGMYDYVRYGADVQFVPIEHSDHELRYVDIKGIGVNGHQPYIDEQEH